MQFKPKTDKEIAEMNVWPAGYYDFEVLEGQDTHSKKGNEMIVLKIKVFNNDSGFIILTDYLLEVMPKKLKHAAVMCGLLDKYNTGTLSGLDFVSCVGKLQLGIEKDETGQYPDKNNIKDYGLPKDLSSVTPPAQVVEPIDDDIPY